MITVNLLRRIAQNVYTSVRDPAAVHRALRALKARPSLTCPLCDYHGPFFPHGPQQRPNARCPSCDSVERHRLLKLALDRQPDLLAGRKVLHFAPEPVMAAAIRQCRPAQYVSADLFNPADLKLDIEAIDLPDGAFGAIVCSHVLEHVDDRKAIPELRRILAPDGTLIVMVPVVDGWDATFEPDLATPEERLRYLGHAGHRRIYGADFVSRLKQAGFKVAHFAADGFEVVEYGLLRGERVFIATKV